MHGRTLQRWQHSHTFGQDARRPGETRTAAVIAITATMMVVEIAVGLFSRSMALFADGLHMASHASALAISVAAYAYARRQARNTAYSFGTGKVNALAGFSGAVLLGVFALIMAYESVRRLLHPVQIAFGEAIVVALIGLLINGVSVLILGERRHGHAHDHHEHGRQHHHDRHHDHNLRSAYLHVLADTLTSVLAIGGLAAARYAGFVWMDPAVGIVGAVLVARWSVGLLRTTSAVLLDRQAPQELRDSIVGRIEMDRDSRVSDLHVWSIGPGIYAVELAIVGHGPLPPAEYKARLAADLGLEHVTVEVNRCDPDGTEDSIPLGA